jgi:hypothetical protein
MILASCRLRREPEQVRAGEVVMMADPGPAQAAEKALGVVRVDLVGQSVDFPMVDPMQRVAGVKRVP